VVNLLDDNREFKDSALGMIPKNWELLSFKNITNVRQGLQIAISKRFKEYKPNRYIYITVEYVNKLDDQASIEFIEAPSKRVICHKNDILFTRTGATGKIITGIEGVFHNNFFLVDYDTSKVFREYFLHYLNFEPIQKDIQFKAGTTTIPDLKHGDFYSLVFLKPTLPEQQQIAKILDTVDKAIAQTQTLIAKYKRVKTGLMQDLLTRGIDEHGQLRDPRTHKFKRSPLGMIPDEWEVKALSSITFKIIDGTHFTPKYIDHGVPFLRVTDIQDTEINFDHVKKISLQEHQFLTQRCKPEYGDIFYSKNGTIGLTKVIDWYREFSIFVSLCLIKPNFSLINPWYLEEILKSAVVNEQIRMRSKQGTIINLHLEEIREVLIPVPSIDEQIRLIEAWKKYNICLINEELYLSKLQKIKTGLMQDLLTGKTSVKPLLTNQP
jgi:type I restriction enzyme S subunit